MTARSLTLGLLAVVAVAAPAWAQLSPGITPNIEQRVQPNAPVSPLAVSPEEMILTGQNDIVLLQPQQLFDLHASAGTSFTSNAFLSNSHQAADVIFNPSAGARAATQIGQWVDVFAGLDVALNRYAKNPVLDFDELIGTLGAAAPVGRFRAGLSYTGTDVQKRDFSGHLVTLHDIAATISLPLQVQEVALEPTFTITRTYADPAAFKSYQFRWGLSANYKWSETVGLFTSPSVYYRNYDNYFESITMIGRADHGIDAPAGLAWAPLPYLTATLELDVSYNSSTLPVNNYEAVTAMPSVRVDYRF